MKNKFLSITLTAVFLGLAFAAFSQGGPPPPPPPPPPPGSGVPIDGGIFMLLSAGLVYGAKKLYRSE